MLKRTVPMAGLRAIVLAAMMVGAATVTAQSPPPQACDEENEGEYLCTGCNSIGEEWESTWWKCEGGGWNADDRYFGSSQTTCEVHANECPGS